MRTSSIGFSGVLLRFLFAFALVCLTWNPTRYNYTEWALAQWNPADRSEKEIVEFGKQTDYKRPAQPQELSPAYVFLAAPSCASYITGIVLPVTGSVGS